MDINEKVSGLFNKAKVGTGIKAVESKRKAAVNSANSEISGLEQTIRYLYEKIGRKVHTTLREKHNDGLLEDDLREADRLSEKIAAKRAELNQINKDFDLQIEAIRADQLAVQGQLRGNLCPSCGFGNVAGALFCAKCGGALVKNTMPDKTSKTEDAIVCVKCGMENGPESLFCFGCGNKLASDNIDSLEKQEMPDDLPSASLDFETAENSDPLEENLSSFDARDRDVEKELLSPTIFCTECGAANDSNDSFCCECGVELERIAQRTDEAPLVQESWICANCNAENSGDALFCEKCGIKYKS